MNNYATNSTCSRISSHPEFVVVGLITMIGGLAGIPQTIVWLCENPLAAIAAGYGIVFYFLDCITPVCLQAQFGTGAKRTGFRSFAIL